jgi:hypothetical protein
MKTTKYYIDELEKLVDSCQLIINVMPKKHTTHVIKEQKDKSYTIIFAEQYGMFSYDFSTFMSCKYFIDKQKFLIFINHFSPQNSVFIKQSYYNNFEKQQLYLNTIEEVFEFFKIYMNLIKLR